MGRKKKTYKDGKIQLEIQRNHQNVETICLFSFKNFPTQSRNEIELEIKNGISDPMKCVEKCTRRIHIKFSDDREGDWVPMELALKSKRGTERGGGLTSGRAAPRGGTVGRCCGAT